jgi:hypothetical protein
MTDRTLPITEDQKEAFWQMQEACENGQLACLSAVRKSDGQPVTLACIVWKDGEEYAIKPVAEMLTEDAVDLYEPPISDEVTVRP